MKHAQLRSVIHDLANQVRECRTDRSIPMLIGQGYCIAKAGSISSLARVKGQPGSFNFVGSWNRSTSYWDKKTAQKVLESVAPDVKARNGWELEVIHRNDLRDRHEESYLATLRMLFKGRHAITRLG